MIEADDARIFEIGALISIVYTDTGKDFILKGFLFKITNSAIIIDNPLHGRALIALDSIKKVFETPKNKM